MYVIHKKESCAIKISLKALIISAWNDSFPVTKFAALCCKFKMSNHSLLKTMFQFVNIKSPT